MGVARHEHILVLIALGDKLVEEILHGLSHLSNLRTRKKLQVYRNRRTFKDFERYLANHPSTPLRDSVNYYYNLLVDRVAEKEFQTGRLYLRMEKPQAAVIYFKEFLETYPNAKRRQETLFLISDAYTDLDQFESARQYLAIAKEESSDNADVQKRVKKAEEKIAKAEESYEKRLKKESEKKRLQKEEKNLAN